MAGTQTCNSRSMGGNDMGNYDPESEELWDDFRRACVQRTEIKGQCCMIIEEVISRGYTHILVGEVTMLIQYCCYCGRKLQH
jgi:hypothetical protein